MKIAANLRNLLIVLLLILPFNLFFFPARQARLAELSGLENPTLDVRFSYTPQQVYTLQSGLGDAGRKLYALTEVSLDLAYPGLYNLLLYLLLTALLSRLLPVGSPWLGLNRLPGAVFAADILENSAITILLLSYPRKLAGLAQLASLFTSLKWILGLACGVLIGISALLLGLRALLSLWRVRRS